MTDAGALGAREHRRLEFVPDPAAAAGGGTTTVHLTVNVPHYMGGDLPRDVVDKIVAGLGQFMGRGGVITDGRGGALRTA